MKAARTASSARSGETASRTCEPVKNGITSLKAFDRGCELLDRVLGVAEQHHGLRVQEEWVLDSGEAGVHAALQHDDLSRLVDVQDRHAVDGTALVATSVGIDDVVRADHEGHVGARKIGIRL